ncbi:hypothetical protein TNCV_4404511 [Trichonephila clavipes]|uniref:Uncharacterized protein n=1 Tax=Trichonephila clavipes TaxID=2585209 RepID=A0A8X6VFT2_TRICX|nr:hypothetical protein TNCV_4404511 [Trichonephila clavipes]
MVWKQRRSYRLISRINDKRPEARKAPTYVNKKSQNVKGSPRTHKEIRYRAHTQNRMEYIVVGLVTSSSPVPLKTRRVEECCTLNLPRAQTSFRWCNVVVRRSGASPGDVHVT